MMDIHRLRQMRKQKKRHGVLSYIKKTVMVLGIFLLYVLLGAIIPFIHQKDVGNAYKQAYSQDTYQRNTISVDRAAIVETSDEAMDARIHMIQSAKEKIMLTTFSIKTDKASQKICAALYDAARRGVKIEFLIDGLSGSWDMKYHPMFYALGSHENVTIKYYNMFQLYAPWTFNGRLHDKFIVVDDKQLLLGGRNTSNYFLGTFDQSVLSYDREVYVYNTADTKTDSVIAQVDQYFDSLWDSKYSKVYFDKAPKAKRKKVAKEREQLIAVYKNMKEEAPHLWKTDVDYKEYTTAVNHIELVSNPIHIYSKEPYIWYTLTSLMKDAKEEVLIQSPYLVLNDRMYSDLKEIGEDLEHYEVLINSIAAGDNICASSDYKLSRKKILDTNVQVFEFQGDHSMHNKSLVIDHRLSVIGSFNFDMRSTYLDTETMLVIDGEEFANELENNIRKMQEDSLLVQEDGSYKEDGSVTKRELSSKKGFLFSFLPYVLRPVRFLL